MTATLDECTAPRRDEAPIATEARSRNPLRQWLFG